MPGINNIGNRTFRSKGGPLGSMYQKNQKNETDPKGKLVIQNFDKDLNLMIFWGWDVIAADELDESYIFQLAHRGNPKLRVYITLGRDLQTADRLHNNDLMYQCYVHDDAGNWSDSSFFYAKDLTYKNFWAVIEEIVNENETDPLPF